MTRPKEQSTAAGGGAAAEPSHETPPTGPTGGREERGDSASSHRHPPHRTENAEDAPLHQDDPGPDEEPVLPANAHGKDKVPTEQAQPIDEESMYDRRPGEDKDRPPSSPDSP